MELRPNTLEAKAWGHQEIEMVYRCNVGVAPTFIAALDGQPLKVTDWDEEGDVQAMELTSHPFFVITLFQHERAALECKPAPLVQAFIHALAV